MSEPFLEASCSVLLELGSSVGAMTITLPFWKISDGGEIGVASFGYDQESREH